MRNIIKRSPLILLVLTIFFGGCEKLLEVNPKQSIDSRTALESPEAIKAALNSVYAYLQQVSQYGRDMIVIPEVLADNTNHTNNPTELYSQFRNQPGAHLGIWGSSYSAINEINNILKVLENPPAGVSAEFAEIISGQAYFLRALYYHNLSKIYGYDPGAQVEAVNYGSIPLVTEPVLGTDQITYPARADVNTVYDLLYADLTRSFELLEGKVVQGSNPEYYASDAAALALFSRVALYREDYDVVIQKATDALNLVGSKFMTQASYVAGWRQMKLPESIFEIVFHVGDHSDPVNTSLRVTLTSRITLSSTSFSGRGNIVVAPELLSLYSSADTRRGLFANGVGRNASRTEITKYMSRSGTNHDNVPVIRVSEVLLNRAEAYAYSNLEDLARLDLNQIRERAGLAPVGPGVSGNALKNEIALQRRLELAFEGHRFFDLKRRGQDIVKPIGNVGFEEGRILAPLPYSEVERNTKLKQNFGF